MSICRGCPHYSFEIALSPSDPYRRIRVIYLCAVGMSRPGMREACNARPVRDNGLRRRRTDVTADGQSAAEPGGDNGSNAETAKIC